MKPLICAFVITLFLSLTTTVSFSQDIKKTLMKGDWQVCNVDKPFEELSEMTLYKDADEDPCGTWAEKSIERKIEFRPVKGILKYREAKMNGMTMEENKGIIGSWKFNKRKKTIKFKFADGKSSVMHIEEITKEKLVLKKVK